MTSDCSIICVDCGFAYPDQGLPFCCPRCGGLFDYASLPHYSPDLIDPNLPGIWQYQHTFGLLANVPILSMGEGNTPLIQDRFMGCEIALKMESLNPSGSYKDRAMALIVAHILARQINEAVEDSSGNAGASFAAYAARAGIRGTVFVPAHVSTAKGRQIEVYGAALERIEGPRSAAASAVMERALGGAAYASHAYLPFGKRGIATMAYEIWAQLGNKAPGSVIAPVGHGHLLMGIIEGFQALYSAGLIQKMPYFVGVQAVACAPIYAAWQLHGKEPQMVAEQATIAEGVSVATPRQGKALLNAMDASRGRFLAVPEDRINVAFHELAQQGFYVEPTSALVWDALKTLGHEIPQSVVLVLTGSGLKTTIED